MHEEELVADFKVTREALLSFQDLRPLQLDLLTETNYSNSEVQTIGYDEDNITTSAVEEEDPRAIELRSEIEILEDELAHLEDREERDEVDDDNIDESKLMLT